MSASGENRRPAPLELPCEPPSRRVVERLDEPIEAGECRLYEGAPCILFEDWDYAEDWSGEFVQTLPPEVLASAPILSVSEFWALVRRVHAVG